MNLSKIINYPPSQVQIHQLFVNLSLLDLVSIPCVRKAKLTLIRRLPTSGCVLTSNVMVIGDMMLPYALLPVTVSCYCDILNPACVGTLLEAAEPHLPSGHASV